MNDKKNKIITGAILFLVLTGGLIAGLLLVARPQLFQQKASVSGGVAKAYLSPESKDINAGDTFPVKVYFDTGGVAISAFMVQLEYSYSGSEPPITATSIDINQDLVTNDMWDFPIKSVNIVGGKAVIKIAGFSNSIDGFNSGGQKELATLNFRGNSTGSITVSFNSTESKITKKADGADTLMVPQSSGTYSVAGSYTPTPSPTPYPTVSPDYSPTPVPIIQPVPSTGAGEITLISLGVGFVLLIASAFFAF